MVLFLLQPDDNKDCIVPHSLYMMPGMPDILRCTYATGIEKAIFYFESQVYELYVEKISKSFAC